jgi:hypothetical protein
MGSGSITILQDQPGFKCRQSNIRYDKNNF